MRMFISIVAIVAIALCPSVYTTPRPTGGGNNGGVQGAIKRLCSMVPVGIPLCSLDKAATISCTGAGIGTWTNCPFQQRCTQGACAAVNGQKNVIMNLCSNVPSGASICNADASASILCTDANDGAWTDCAGGQTCTQGACVSAVPHQAEIQFLCSGVPNGTLVCNGAETASVLCSGLGTGNWTDCAAGQTCSQGVCAETVSHESVIQTLCSSVPSGVSVCSRDNGAAISCTDLGAGTWTDCGAGEMCSQGLCIAAIPHQFAIQTFCSTVPNNTVICNGANNATILCNGPDNGTWTSCSTGQVCMQGACVSTNSHPMVIQSLCSMTRSGTAICNWAKTSTILCSGDGVGTWTNCTTGQTCSQGVCVTSPS